MSLAVPVAPLGGHQVLTFLLLIGLLLGLAVVLGQLARRFGLPSVVGELTAGVLVGPSVVGALMPGLWDWLRLGEPGQLHLVDGVGQLGVLLLVGLTGINVDLSLLRRKAGTVVWVGTTALLAPLAVGVAVGFALPATLVADGTGRLTFAAFVGVAMCVSSIPVISEATAIPRNEGISEGERGARRREIFAPYHDRIDAAISRRLRYERPTVLVSLHSFTPVYAGIARPWHIGTLYHRDTHLPPLLLELLRAEGDLVVGDNEPYAVSDETDYTIPVHGEARGLVNTGIEIRQDLIADQSGQQQWAERLARILAGIEVELKAQLLL